jgi:hypothetical protein
MYKFKLFKNEKQIYSSNSLSNVKSWMLADKREMCTKDLPPTPRYEIKENKSPNFRQALH